MEKLKQITGVIANVMIIIGSLIAIATMAYSVAYMVTDGGINEILFKAVE